MPASLLHREDDPFFYLGEFPVRLITLIVAVHSLAMVLATLLLAAGHGSWMALFAYSSDAVAHGQLWRLVSYAFVATPNLSFLLEMVMLYYFGKEVEHGLGWQRFGILYLGLILLGPVMLQAFGFAGLPQKSAGAQEVAFAIFAAFVVMHPAAQFFFGLAARWVFIALLAIYSLQLLADREMPRLLVMISSCFLAMVLMRRADFKDPLFGWSFQWSLPGFRPSNSRFSVMRGGISSAVTSQANVSKPVPVNPDQEMDRLLEKISSKGIGSLSAAERTALEQARQAILQRGGKGSPR
jgi:membrane associated rhomboid family serine protease